MDQFVGKDPSYLLGVSFPKWAFGTCNIPEITCLGEEPVIPILSNLDWTGRWLIVPGLNGFQQEGRNIFALKALTTVPLLFTLMSLLRRKGLVSF